MFLTRTMVAIIATSTFCCYSSSGDQQQEKFEALTTLSGDVFRKVELLRIEEDSVVIRHSIGISRLPITDIPENVRRNWDLPSDDQILKAEESKRMRHEAWVRETEETPKPIRDFVHEYKQTRVIPRLRGRRLSVGMIGYFLAGYVVQVQNEKEMIVRRGEQYIWLSGVPTQNVADGDVFKSNGVFYVSGTQVYTNRLVGRRTALRVVPFDVEKHLNE